MNKPLISQQITHIKQSYEDQLQQRSSQYKLQQQLQMHLDLTTSSQQQKYDILDEFMNKQYDLLDKFMNKQYDRLQQQDNQQQHNDNPLNKSNYFHHKKANSSHHLQQKVNPQEKDTESQKISRANSLSKIILIQHNDEISTEQQDFNVYRPNNRKLIEVKNNTPNSRYKLYEEIDQSLQQIDNEKTKLPFLKLKQKNNISAHLEDITKQSLLISLSNHNLPLKKPVDEFKQLRYNIFYKSVQAKNLQIKDQTFKNKENINPNIQQDRVSINQGTNGLYNLIKSSIKIPIPQCPKNVQERPYIQINSIDLKLQKLKSFEGDINQMPVEKVIQYNNLSILLKQIKLSFFATTCKQLTFEAFILTEIGVMTDRANQQLRFISKQIFNLEEEGPNKGLFIFNQQINFELDMEKIQRSLSLKYLSSIYLMINFQKINKNKEQEFGWIYFPLYDEKQIKKEEISLNLFLPKMQCHSPIDPNQLKQSLNQIKFSIEVEQIKNKQYCRKN